MNSPILSATAARRALDAGARFVDCRFDLADTARGEREWCQAHVPGAVYANLDQDLSNLRIAGRGRHPLPSAAEFSATLSRWGIGSDDHVIVYDEASSAMAARLWWLLRMAGHARIGVLDGGIAAWRAAGLPLNDLMPRYVASDYRVSFNASTIVDSVQVDHLRGTADGLLLDARTQPRFRGEQEPIDAVAGHIPGAICRPFQDNLESDGRFKSAEALRAAFAALLGPRAPGALVAMCGSGVSACHHLLGMAHAGLDGARLYAGSWSEWISDPSRPVATGAD